MKTKITLKELEELVGQGFIPKINSPTGWVSITDTYRKYGPGLQIKFKDGSEMVCSNLHRVIYSGEWVYVQELIENQCIGSKWIESIIPVDPQEWVDFTIDAEHQSYVHNGIVHHNSGKSLIIFLLVSFLLRVTNQNILIIVPSISLTEQLLGNFKEYQVDTDVARLCHLVYSGKEKIGFAHQKITVALWQSIYNLPADFYSKYGSVIVDEAHQADAVCITKIISKCSHIPFRFGLTGTLDGTKTHEMCLRGMFGPLTRTATTKTLMTDGILSELKIECLVIRYTDPECRMMKNLKYQDEIAYITSHQERTRILVDVAMSQPKNTLLLFNFVDTHGRVLFRLAEQRAKERGKQVYFIYGGTPVEERERIRALVELHDNIVIIASVGVFAVGINMKNLHCVIFGHPYKSRIRNLQSIGRGLRLSAGKDSCLLIDICDDLSFKSHQNTVLKHFLARLKIYESEHFRYQIKKITL